MGNLFSSTRPPPTDEEVLKMASSNMDRFTQRAKNRIQKSLEEQLDFQHLVTRVTGSPRVTTVFIPKKRGTTVELIAEAAREHQLPVGTVTEAGYRAGFSCTIEASFLEKVLEQIREEKKKRLDKWKDEDKRKRKQNEQKRTEDENEKKRKQDEIKKKQNKRKQDEKKQNERKKKEEANKKRKDEDFFEHMRNKAKAQLLRLVKQGVHEYYQKWHFCKEQHILNALQYYRAKYGGSKIAPRLGSMTVIWTANVL